LDVPVVRLLILERGSREDGLWLKWERLISSSPSSRRLRESQRLTG
jgi:hypothetical protein